MKKERTTKKAMKVLALLLVFAAACALLAACGAPAPAGMYAPVDAMKYVEGVEHAIFSVPEDYAVTMSSNTLAAVKGQSVFSLQCRHSDYVYSSLKMNYEELKSQLLGLYGDYEETLDYDCKVAGQKALEARYTLHISGEDFDYVQYFFYEGSSQFYLFTYSEPSGKLDETLLKQVVDTVRLERENYTSPAGMKPVQNATVEQISSDTFELYIPDDWILDTSSGRVCMRVPSKNTVSSILFDIVEVEDLQKYVDGYAAQFASDTDLSGCGPLDKYILASVRRMIREYKDFKVVTDVSDTSKTTELTNSSTMMTLKDSFLLTYTSAENVEFTYIEYTAKLGDFNDHGSGGLFMDASNSKKADESTAPSAEETRIVYRIRQYFTRKGNTLYFITYLSTDASFKNMENDAIKVVKNFVIK